QRRAEVELARGPFDPTLRASAGHTHDERPVLPAQRSFPGERTILTDTTSLDLGASWLTTWGMTLLPGAGLARVHQRFVDSVPNTDPYQQANVGITVIQPLLRGAGTVGAAYAIDAAKAGREASTHAIVFTAQQRVFFGVAAYFQLVAASEQVGLLRENQ